MGVKNYLVEGVSGAGKTTVGEALEQRGYHVIHGDRGLAYFGDPETGDPLEGSAHEHFIWDVEKVRDLVADQTHSITFFCGGSRNHHRFIDLLDGVFLLEVDLDTMVRRLALRPDDEWAGPPPGMELLAQVHATKEDQPKTGIIIDATAPIDRVVDAILGNANLV